MGIKDNFSQAVKELWKKDGQDNERDSAGSGAPTELDKYLKQGNGSNNPRGGAVFQPNGNNMPLETPYYRPSAPENNQTVNNAPPAGSNSRDDFSGGINQNVQNIQKSREQSADNAEPARPEPRNVSQGIEQNNPDRQSEQINNNTNAYNQNTGAYSRNGGYDQNQGGYGQNDQGQGGYNQNAAYNRDFRGNYNGGGDYIPPGAGNNMPPQSSPNEVDEITVISKNTIIDGNIRSLANMQIDGNIKGNVETTRNVDMTGKIVGDITCNNAGMNSAAMQGNVSLKGRMKMDRDTILIGDLSSQYADINGRVRGKLDIVGKAELKRDAIVFGDINASTIAVTDGAIIQGYVNTTFLSKEDSRNVFPEAISIDSKEG